MNEPFLRHSEDGIVISVRIQPKARKSEVAGIHGSDLKIRIQAPPVEGKANAALVEFLAEALDLPGSAIEIVRGESSRNKQILIRGLTAEAILRRLAPPTCR